MKLAALRYSPEIAEAFHPTETERPATKKSDADLEDFAERKPIQIVITTVMAEKARIQGSTPLDEDTAARNGKAVRFMRRMSG
jgi:hypothetical protein